MKYGIFLSHHEMRERPETLANVVETDEWIETPEEMFETREAALAKLKEDKEKYSPCIREMRGNGGVFYDCKVYFVAACEYRYEEDEDDVTATDSDDPTNYVWSREDDFEFAPFERHLKIEPKKFKLRTLTKNLSWTVVRSQLSMMKYISSAKQKNLKAMSVSVILTRTLLMKWQTMKNGTASHIVRMAMR